MDLVDTLRTTIGGTGYVRREYGGFEIGVEQPDAFPWARVFEILLSIQHDIWVERGETHTLILSKPPSV